MLKRNFLFGILALTTLLACKTSQLQESKTNSDYSNIEINGKLYAAVFQQTAAEYKALCLQAFNIATWQIDQRLSESYQKPLAIITDIDETFLDNSPYAVQMARQGKSFDEKTWNQWTSKGEAIALEGSLDFFNYAASKNIEIFYITNRNQNDRKGTLENLKSLNFPFADDAHLIVRDTESSKEVRRQKISETHEIVMLLGDNLSDFSVVFDKKTKQQRDQNVLENAALFGKKFIVLPNMGYGDWEAVLFDYKHDKTAKEKDSIYNHALKGF